MRFEDRILFEETNFSYVNPHAQVVLVGITPGNSQLKGSREGKSDAEIKKENAFAGNMRKPLISMLDSIGINGLLGIASCESLWGDDFNKIEMTSLLKEATYILKKDGTKEMFKDTKKIAKSAKLTQMLHEGFVADCENYKNARLFVACGPNVYGVLEDLQKQNLIKVPIVAIAHPSGANAGRISCYLGNKDPKDASYEWCVAQAENAKQVVAELIASSI